MAIFMRWRQFGGLEHGISLSDCLTLPEWLLHDIGYIVGELETQRRRRPKKKKPKNGKGKLSEMPPLEDLPPQMRDAIFAKINEERQHDQLTSIE